MARGTEYRTVEPVNKEQRESVPKSGVECSLCGESLTSEAQLRTHVRTHAVGGVNCEVCGRYFRQMANLEIHKREECGREPSFSCDYCTEKFHYSAQLKGHIAEEHSQEEMKLSEGSVETATELSVEGEQRYQCRLCPRAFNRVGSLNYHVSRKHSGAEERDPSNFPFRCNQCGNRYKSTTQLCRHRKWECGKDPMFKCHICTKKFHHRHGLKQHIRLHVASSRLAASGQAVTAGYCCDKCGRGYKLKSSLNNHIKWECGKEPLFECTQCHVRFSHKGNLKKHIATKHTVKLVDHEAFFKDK